MQKGRLRWGDRSDRAMAKLLAQEKGVRRDIHKMHAFVRFREVTPEGAKRRAFAAWFEPTHHIVELPAPFFINGDAAFSNTPSMVCPSGLPEHDDYDWHQSSNRMPIAMRPRIN